MVGQFAVSGIKAVCPPLLGVVNHRAILADTRPAVC
jgi:hypothetical protein